MRHEARNVVLPSALHHKSGEPAGQHAVSQQGSMR